MKKLILMLTMCILLFSNVQAIRIQPNKLSNLALIVSAVSLVGWQIYKSDDQHACSLEDKKCLEDKKFSDNCFYAAVISGLIGLGCMVK